MSCGAGEAPDANSSDCELLSLAFDRLNEFSTRTLLPMRHSYFICTPWYSASPPLKM